MRSGKRFSSLDQTLKRGRQNLFERLEDPKKIILSNKTDKDESDDEEFECILNDAIQQSTNRALHALKVQKSKLCDFVRLLEQSLKIKGRTFQDTILPDQLQKLRSPTEWLGSTIIDVYALLIAEDFPSVGVFSSYFFRSDCNQLTDGTLSWVQESDALEKNLIFIPLNTRNIHWSLLVIDMRNQIVAHLDSLNCNLTGMRERVQSCIDEIMRMLSKLSSIPRQNWKIRCSCPCPKQNNGYDCGVFVCYFIRFLAEAASQPENSCSDPIALLSKITSIDALVSRRAIEARLLQSSNQ